MIKLRLQRKGRKKRPFYHIVVADSRSPRDGRIIEQLGRFDNVSENKQLVYDEERVIHWLKIGAQPSDTVRNILKHEGVLYKMHLMRWGKSDEEIEAALAEWKAAREAKHGEDDVSRKAKQQEVLKAEEKEYKKQVEEKAAAAAKELEKKKEAEAKAAEKAAADKEEEAEKTVEAAHADEEPKAKETAEAAPADETEEVKTEEAPAEEKEPEAKTEEAPAEEKEPEVKAEEAPVEEKKPDVKAEEAPVTEEEVKAEEPAAEEAPAEEVKTEEPAAEEAKKEEPVKEEKSETSAETVSTDMNANEAIEHIKNTAIEDLKGFVPEDEERVTVQRAWESKQEE